MNKKNALATYLDLDSYGQQYELIDKGQGFFEHGSREYLVLTDAQATKRAKEAIKEQVWAVNANFLRGHINKDVSEKAIESLASLCEDANPIILALIKNFNQFAKEAICADGRGHFISSYDGEESEFGGYFIYRIN